jgi:hypothetical protein
MSDRDKSIQNTDNNTIVFFIDSGCTDLINDKSYFNNLMMLKNPIKIAIAKDKNT